MSNEWDEPQDEFNADRIPPEPPMGTWVIDRHGATAQRRLDPDGTDGWGLPGFYSMGQWEAMWRSRGPLRPCSPWGVVEKEHARRMEDDRIREDLVRALNEADRAYVAAKERLETFDRERGSVAL